MPSSNPTLGQRFSLSLCRPKYMTRAKAWVVAGYVALYFTF